MVGHDIITIGASAGGWEALQELIHYLPEDLPAAIFIAMHMPPYSASVVPDLLTRRGPFPALHPKKGEVIRAGRIFVAPPDHHLLVHRNFVRTVQGPKENKARPAIDPLFRSAAVAYGPRAVGVLLSGKLDDGSAGLRAIKRRGGVTIVQDPAEAAYPDMPRNALTHVEIDHCLRVAEMPSLLERLALDAVDEKTGPPISPELEKEAAMNSRPYFARSSITPRSPPSASAAMGLRPRYCCRT
jgi:two-component system chemotaxis response regulator CheB